MNHADIAIVTVFGSSRPAPGDDEYQSACEVGRALADAGFVLCNGGYGGTMEASARGAKEARASGIPPNARTMGVVAAEAGNRPANRWIDTVVTVDSMVNRLLRLISLGDAYVVLKGGTGTLLEFAAVWEFMNKGLVQEKPIIVMGTFWNGVVQTLRDELAREGLQRCTSYVTVVHTAAECVAALRSWKGRS